MKHLAYKTRFVISPEKSFCWNPLAHIWQLGWGPALETAFVLKRQSQLYFTKYCSVFLFLHWMLEFCILLEFCISSGSTSPDWPPLWSPVLPPITPGRLGPLHATSPPYWLSPLGENLQAPWQLSTLILQRGVVGDWIIWMAMESRWELWLYSDHKQFQFVLADERFKYSWRLWLLAGKAESSVSLFRIFNVLSLSRIPNSEKGRGRGGIKERKADFFFWTSTIQLWSSLSSRLHAVERPSQFS